MTYTTEMRLVDIADEAFGLGPVEPVEATLSRIEQGIAQQRRRIAELERTVARMQPVITAAEAHRDGMHRVCDPVDRAVDDFRRSAVCRRMRCLHPFEEHQAPGGECVRPGCTCSTYVEIHEARP